MSKKHKEKQVQLDDVPILDVLDDVIEEQTITEIKEIDWEPTHNFNEISIRYVVTRDGLRVSDKDYPSSDEPRAIIERDFWKSIVNKWPDSTKIEIVKYDKKKHRIW